MEQNLHHLYSHTCPISTNYWKLNCWFLFQVILWSWWNCFLQWLDLCNRSFVSETILKYLHQINQQQNYLSIKTSRHLRGRCRWKRRKGTKITTTFCIAFLSPIVKISHTLDFATPNLFCRFATFPPLQRRNLPPKEEADYTIFCSAKLYCYRSYIYLSASRFSAVGDDASASRIKKLLDTRIGF